MMPNVMFGGGGTPMGFRPLGYANGGVADKGRRAPAPEGFMPPLGPATQALVPYINPTTGESWTAPSGGWTPASGWVAATGYTKPYMPMVPTDGIDQFSDLYGLPPKSVTGLSNQEQLNREQLADNMAYVFSPTPAEPEYSMTDDISGYGDMYPEDYDSQDSGVAATSSGGGSWIDDVLGALGSDAGKLTSTLGPMVLQKGIDYFFPGMTDVQRQMAGYQGGIPEYNVLRQRVPGTNDPTRRPGSSGQRYFTDVQYVPKGQGTPPALDPAALAAANMANPNRQTRPIPALAAGGIATMARGRYLDGATDGMADKVPARIDGQQEARLSDGEFVIPADVVSHLGNGNSESGAKVLFAMMDRVRKARTGNKKQGKKINARKMLPA